MMRTVCVLAVLAGLAGQAAADSVLANGGFEDGNLTNWTSSGNGSVQVLGAAGLPPLGPLSGSFFALVGNGPADAGNDGVPDSGVLTSAEFTIGALGGSLSFSFDFLTAEFTGLDALEFDSFLIELVPSVGAATVLASGDVSDLGFSPIDGFNPVAAPDGSTFFEHLGSQTISLALTQGTYALRFTVMDDFFADFDSALLIDSVNADSIVPEPPPQQTVPEPSATLLLGLAAAAGLLRRRARRAER